MTTGRINQVANPSSARGWVPPPNPWLPGRPEATRGLGAGLGVPAELQRSAVGSGTGLGRPTPAGSGYLPGGSARRTVSAPWPALCRTAANLAVVLGDRGPRRTPLWNTWVRVVTRPRATFHVPAWTRPRPQLPGERAVRRTGHRVPY